MSETVATTAMGPDYVAHIAAWRATFWRCLFAADIAAAQRRYRLTDDDMAAAREKALVFREEMKAAASRQQSPPINLP
ncbi:hypothetical protein [Mesorhizobium sp. M0522]|uniref:hypothetical protein n=1 Tax=Mesorhizobium sp. M0522 TaxID=2956958 RepID=UPI00333A96CF